MSMIVNRPRGKFTLELVKTERVDSDTATKLKVLENQLEKASKAENKVEVARIQREINSTRESGLRQYPFLAEKDRTLDKLAEFLAIQSEDNDTYSMFNEIEKVVVSALKVRFQNWFFANDIELEKLQVKLAKATTAEDKASIQESIDECLARDNEADFISTLEDSSFSGRKETPKSLMAKAMKLFKTNPVEASALLARAQEMISGLSK